MREMKINLGRFEDSSSSSCLSHSDDNIRVCKGRESCSNSRNREQNIISVEIKHNIKATVSFGEKSSDYQMVLDLINNEKYEQLYGFVFSIIIGRISSPEKMNEFLNDIIEEATENGITIGKNQIRSNLEELIFSRD